MIFDHLNAAPVARLTGELIRGADALTWPEPVAGAWAHGSFDWSPVDGAQLLPGLDGTRVTGGANGADPSTNPGAAASDVHPGADASSWSAPQDGVDLAETAAQLLPALDDLAGCEPPLNPAFSHHAWGGDFFGVLSHA